MKNKAIFYDASNDLLFEQTSVEYIPSLGFFVRVHCEIINKEGRSYTLCNYIFPNELSKFPEINNRFTYIGHL